MFDSTKFTSNVIGSCRVGTNFAKSSNQNQVLRCYKGLNGFIIAGFNAITASTQL